MVQRQANVAMLNAGRGDPNFLATIPRHGFWQLGRFAMPESERAFAYMPEGVGGFPKSEGLTERFELFLRENRGPPGIDFFAEAVSYVRDQMGLSDGDFLYEMCEGILGSSYPVPDRMLKMSEIIVGQYLQREMIGKHPFIAWHAKSGSCYCRGTGSVPSIRPDESPSRISTNPTTERSDALWGLCSLNTSIVATSRRAKSSTGTRSHSTATTLSL